jgi:hypothetical protein
MAPRSIGSSDELRLLDEDPGRFAFFAWRNLTICVWLATPTARDIPRLVAMGNTRAADSTLKLSDLHLVTRSVGLPDADARNTLLEASRGGAPHLAAVGVWMGGSGFWASAVRSFVTGLSVLVRGPFELGVFAEVSALATWLPEIHAARTGVTITASELHQVLLRAQQRAERPAMLESQAVD